jgi:hypothetical protein
MKISVENRVYLDKFVLREYQKPLFKAIVEGKYKKIISVMPRRAGKDLVAFNALLLRALQKVGTYWIVYPSYSQARKAVWQCITNDGIRVLDYVPPALRKNVHETEMRIELINGSTIQLIGADNVSSLVGTNLQGVILSEYALMDSDVYQYLSPILLTSEGFAVFISTPRGKNHFYTLAQVAKQNPKDWFYQLLTIDDTGHVTREQVQNEIKNGVISEDMASQEYYCSFSAGVEGAYWARIIDKMRNNGQIGVVPVEQGRVNTAWDLGVRDSTCIIFWQQFGHQIRIVDYFEHNKEGLEYYAKVLQEKGYLLGHHIAPFDIAVKEFGSGMTRLEQARKLGIKFTVAPQLLLVDGIEAVRAKLPSMWIDEKKCAKLIAALESYRQEWDSKKNVYKNQPLHDWASHGAAAMRYLCTTLPRVSDGLSAEELDRRYLEATAGPQAQLPRFFRDDEPKY